MQDKDLGTKAKGLLTIMLSLPDDWKFSRDGLLAIYKEGETSLTATLNELKQKGYLSIRKLKSDSADADPFVYCYDIFESPDVRVPENRVLGNRLLGNRILDDRVLENPVTYKELNNQERNNKILNDKEHSHQIRGGAGGGSDEDDDLNGEDGTEGEDRDDISVSENGKRIATRSLTARNDARKGRPCSGGVHASTVPDAIPCRTERGAEYGAATDEPASPCSGALWAHVPQHSRKTDCHACCWQARNDAMGGDVEAKGLLYGYSGRSRQQSNFVRLCRTTNDH
jgi:hypothetical protein